MISYYLINSSECFTTTPIVINNTKLLQELLYV